MERKIYALIKYMNWAMRPLLLVSLSILYCYCWLYYRMLFAENCIRCQHQKSFSWKTHTHTKENTHSANNWKRSGCQLDFAFCLFHHLLNKYLHCFSRFASTLKRYNKLNNNRMAQQTHTRFECWFWLHNAGKKVFKGTNEREVNAWKLFIIPFIIALWLLHEIRKASAARQK